MDDDLWFVWGVVEWVYVVVEVLLFNVICGWLVDEVLSL